MIDKNKQLTVLWEEAIDITNSLEIKLQKSKYKRKSISLAHATMHKRFESIHFNDDIENR